MEKLYSISEASEKLGVSVNTLRKWIYLGKICYKKVGKFIRFTESDLMQVIKESPAFTH